MAQIYKNPTPEDLEAIIRDPLSGGAIALLGDGQGNWWAWRREASPMHQDVINSLETDGFVFPDRKAIRTVTAHSVDEARLMLVSETGR